MAIAGDILMVLGCMAGLAGDVMFLNVAYRRSLCWFFGCLFVPLVAELFLLTHWRAAWKPFTLSVFGVGVAILGVLMTG